MTNSHSSSTPSAIEVFKAAAATRNMSIGEAEMRTVHPDAVLIDAYFQNPGTTGRDGYNRAVRDLAGVCGETANQLFDVTVEDNPEYVNGLAPIVDALRADGDTNILMKTDTHAVLLEKRGDQVTLVQSYIGNYSLTQQINKGPKQLPAQDLIADLTTLVEAYQTQNIGQAPHPIETQLFEGKFFKKDRDFGSGAQPATLMSKASQKIADINTATAALVNDYMAPQDQNWDPIKESQKPLSALLSPDITGVAPQVDSKPDTPLVAPNVKPVIQREPNPDSVLDSMKRMGRSVVSSVGKFFRRDVGRSAKVNDMAGEITDLQEKRDRLTKDDKDEKTQQKKHDPHRQQRPPETDSQQFRQ